MFAQLPMYQQKGKSAFNAKLDNTLAFAAHLDHPEKKFKSIHVGGTNGKGSSSHMLASVLQEAGYKTGLYTSPHLKDFRERIRIDGKMVSEKFVVDFIQTNQSFFEEHRLSFFEMTVGMAFTYFAEKMVDIAIVEVGLGGRLDSTNIIVPEVALITNIGLDHVDLLGDTLAKIAFEKAGIIKENIPIVISEYQNDTAEIFERVANSKTAKVIYAEKSLKKKYKTSLLGNYQKKNVNGVVAVLQELQGFEVREEHIVDGLLNVTQNTGLMGRWQMMRIEPKVVCDTAHNSEGLALVLQQVAQQDYDRLHIVLGFVKGKNLDAILPLFPKNAEYYFCRPDIPRGLDVEVLQQNAKAFGLKGKCFTSVGNAYNAALQNADVGDFIFIGGSTFTVAEVV
ncbi:dihydrofolate synthase / folylpolyglutamate synthase [Pricia antarctica]|uniref:Dihydrofolate synthase/folylpolyglutamate synthase n=2 Tax=Pricia antarctica TaxID=641691 RepID=A0A1G7GWQ4_9FLAO|nr:dihydrofolate synthase / folylpolyglutamate synthase [Pricia antarctica]